MARMENTTLKGRYQQRKLHLLSERLYLSDAYSLRERKESSPIDDATRLIGRLFSQVTKFDKFDSLKFANERYEKKLKAAKKRLDVAKTIVLGMSLFDILINGFNEKFLKILEDVNISLEEAGKEKATLATYHETDEGQDDKEKEGEDEDDLEEEGITSESIKEAIEKLKENFAPSNEYKSLLDLPDDQKIFDLDLFRLNLQNSDIAQIKDLRKVIITQKGEIQNQMEKFLKDTKKSTGEVNKFNEFVLQLINKSSYSSSDDLQKDLGLSKGEDGKTIIKNLYDAIGKKGGIKNFSGLSEENQKKFLTQMYGEDYAKGCKIPKIDELLKLMREKTK